MNNEMKRNAYLKSKDNVEDFANARSSFLHKIPNIWK